MRMTKANSKRIHCHAMTTSAGQALEYSRQALAVLDMWINTPGADDEMESFRVAAVHSPAQSGIGISGESQEVETMTAIYNLVRCSDGKTVFSFPAGGPLSGGHVERVAVDAPLMDDEILFTVESAARFEEDWLSGNPASGVGKNMTIKISGLAAGGRAHPEIRPGDKWKDSRGSIVIIESYRFDRVTYCREGTAHRVLHARKTGAREFEFISSAPGTGGRDIDRIMRVQGIERIPGYAGNHQERGEQKMKNAPNLKSSRRISWRSQSSLPAPMRTFAKAWQEMNPIGDTVPPVCAG